MNDAVDIGALAKRSPQHWKAVLSAQIEYFDTKITKSAIPEHELRLPRPEDATANNTGPFLARVETYCIDWYAKPRDPFSWEGYETLIEVLTSIENDDLAPETLARELHAGLAEYKPIGTRDSVVRNDLLCALAARTTYLEAAGHTLDVHLQRRIAIEPTSVRVRGSDRETALFYATGRKSILPALTITDAEQLLKKNVVR